MWQEVVCAPIVPCAVQFSCLRLLFLSFFFPSSSALCSLLALGRTGRGKRPRRRLSARDV